MLLNFRKMIVTCILYLLLPSSLSAPLNRKSYVQQLKRNKNIHSVEVKHINENKTMAQIEEAELVKNLNKNTLDVQNDQIDRSNVDDDDSELNYTKHKDDNVQATNERIDSLIMAKSNRRTTIQQKPETSSVTFIYIDGNLGQKQSVWCWSCLTLFFSIMVMAILLTFFYYNFDLGFYYVNPDRTELLSGN